jgi:hypothetical protein
LEIPPKDRNRNKLREPSMSHLTGVISLEIGQEGTETRGKDFHMGETTFLRGGMRLGACGNSGWLNFIPSK